MNLCTKIRRALAAALALAAFCAAPPANALTEGILNFDVSAEINDDASLTVTETLRFAAAGVEIRRGIIRAIPVVYTDARGRRVTVGLEVLSTTVDGRSLNWKESREGRGLFIRIGDPSRELSPGVHTLTLTYRTTKQIGFFDAYDELYWNVTGSEWSFPIENAAFRLRLPGRGWGEGFDSVEWYTGAYGARDVSGAREEADHSVSSTRRLPPGHGLTVVYTWPKGIVAEPAPTAEDKFYSFLGEHGCLLVSILIWLGVAAGALFLVRAYRAALRERSEEVTVIPLFHAPEGVSPSLARWAALGKVGVTALSAEIIALAVDGFLKIHGDKKSGYSIENTSDGKIPADDCRAQILKKLFPSGEKSTLALEKSHHTAFDEARRIVEGILSAKKERLAKNRSGALKGTFACMAAGSAAAAALSFAGGLGTLTDTAVPCAALGLVSLLSASGAGRRRKSAVRSAVSACLPVTPVLLLMFLIGSADDLPYFVPCAALALLALPLKNRLTHWTPEGQNVLAAARGLEMYITVAEKDRLEALNAPDDSPALFEELLPYAVALDCADIWVKRFEKVLEAASYRPDWYDAPVRTGFFAGSFADSLSGLASGFSSSLSSAAQAPGTTSAHGGGGFSGGGGGGGGGKGW